MCQTSTVPPHAIWNSAKSNAIKLHLNKFTTSFILLREAIKMAATKDQQPWSFDISSLMVLIGEDEELKYRLSRRSLLRCIAAAPIVGFQNYLRLLFETRPLTYFSPYSCKSAPLRNTHLTNAIRLRGLLEDKRYTVYRIPVHSRPGCLGVGNSILLVSWIATTWLFLAGLIIFLVLAPNTTWVGAASCASLTGWCIFLRLVEFANIRPAPVNVTNVTDSKGPDAVFIMGRDNSAFVLEGSREDVKNWTSRGLLYVDHPLGISSRVWQKFARIGSLLVLLFTFSVLPNGSIMDHLAFIFLNGLAQLNVIIGQRLHGAACFAQLGKVTDARVETRTHVYASLLRHFRDIGQSADWVTESGLLPKTDIWDEWKVQVVRKDLQKDPKVLYTEIDQRHKSSPPNTSN